MEPSLTIGIEEEYLLVDPETFDLVADPPDDFMRESKEALGERVTPEFLKCQVEIGTPVCKPTRADAVHRLLQPRSECRLLFDKFFARDHRRLTGAPDGAGTGSGRPLRP